MNSDTSIPQMSLQELRVKVAELCEWRNIEFFQETLSGSGYDRWVGIQPTGTPMVRDIPNYPNDLNACHEFELALTEQQREEYINTLARNVTARGIHDVSEFHFAYVCATAEQRCSAFVATMETLHRSENGGAQLPSLGGAHLSSLLTKAEDSE